MNTLTYSLSTSTQAFPGALSSYIVELPVQYGNTELTVNFDNINVPLYKYIKFLFEFDNDVEVYEISSWPTLDYSDKSITHTFFGALSSNLSVNTIFVSGLKTNQQYDTFIITLSIYKTDLSAYTDLKIVRSLVFDTPTTTNNILLVLETKNPRYLTNVIIPFDKAAGSLASILSTEPTPLAPLTGVNILRTEQATTVDFNLIPITLEDATAFTLCGEATNIYSKQEGIDTNWPVK